MTRHPVWAGLGFGVAAWAALIGLIVVDEVRLARRQRRLSDQNVHTAVRFGKAT